MIWNLRDIERKIRQLERKVCCLSGSTPNIQNVPQFDNQEDAVLGGLVPGDLYFTVIEGEPLLKIVIDPT